MNGNFSKTKREPNEITHRKDLQQDHSRMNSLMSELQPQNQPDRPSSYNNSRLQGASPNMLLMGNNQNSDHNHSQHSMNRQQLNSGFPQHKAGSTGPSVDDFDQQITINNSIKDINLGAQTPLLVDDTRNRESARRLDKDHKMLIMIAETITPDGVLNLQAKNIQQSDTHNFIQELSDKDSTVDSQQSDRSIELNNIFGAGALSYTATAGVQLQRRMETIVRLNLSSNRIQVIKSDFCQCLPNVEVLDLRANRISEISPDISTLTHLRVLKLDKNELTELTEQIFDIVTLTELTFQQNRVAVLSPKIGGLLELKKLNMASNIISKIPETIGQCQKLETLCIQNNRFASFPCSFLQLTNLRELSLEWFIYAKPPKPQYISRKSRDGTQIFESLMVLCNLLQKYKMNECALITFLENYSDENFDKNQRDNRQRTPLHKAAVMGDTGVIDGLLMDKANTDLLDKDSCTPLCLAIRQENYEAAQSLIEGGANVNLGGGIFGSPVHLAVVRLKIPIIQALIDKKADLNKQDSDGNTPLHIVMNIFSKNPERCCHILELLALNGARVNQKNHDHWAPLHTAVRKGQEKGVNAVIRLNHMLAQRKLELFDLNITGGIQQWSSLHLAAHASQLQIIVDLTQAGADIFQRNHTNQLPRHCAKGNYIMTKNIKYIEQCCLAQRFNTFRLQEERLAGLTTREQNILQAQALAESAAGSHDMASSMVAGKAVNKGGRLLKDSKMQPIKSANGADGSEQQKTAEKNQQQFFMDFHLEKGYQCFTRHLRSVKRENMRPVTHLQSQAPISQKSMTLGELADSDVEDFPGAPDNSNLQKNKKDFNIRNESISVPSEGDLDAEVADTLKENASVEIDSIDAEYDVVDEDEARLSRRIQANVIGERTSQRDTGEKNTNSKHALSNNFFAKPSQMVNRPDPSMRGQQVNQHNSQDNYKRSRRQEELSVSRHQRSDSINMQMRNAAAVQGQPPINMAHLIDTLMKKSEATANGTQQRMVNQPSHSHIVLDKLDAVAKLKMNSGDMVYLQAMRQLITSGDLLKIEEEIVQLELLQSIGRSIHTGLIDQLERLLNTQEPLTNQLEDQIQETLEQLQLQKRIGSRARHQKQMGNNQMMQLKIGVLANNSINRQMTFQNRPSFISKGPGSKNLVAHRHHSPSQNMMEGGQSHIGLLSARSNSRHHKDSMLLQQVVAGNQNAMQTNSIRQRALHQKRKIPQSFAGLVPPMQILNAQEKSDSISSSKVIRRFPSNANIQQFAGLSNSNMSQQNEDVNLQSDQADLDDTVRESKSFIEIDGIRMENKSTIPIKMKNDLDKYQMSQANAGSNSYIGPSSQKNKPQKRNRSRFQKVLSDMNQHRASLVVMDEAPPTLNSLDTPTNNIADSNEAEPNQLNHIEQQQQVNTVQPGQTITGQRSNQIDDKLPSSPQSINVFENKIANNIQMGQRLQRQQREETNLANYQQQLMLDPIGEGNGNGQIGQSTVNSARLREKESLILRRQNIINTQQGLNPISPQSLNVEQLHQMANQQPNSLAQPEQRQETLKNNSSSKSRKQKKESSAAKRKQSPAADALANQLPPNRFGKGSRRSTINQNVQRKESKGSKSLKRAESLFTQATQKALKNKKSLLQQASKQEPRHTNNSNQSCSSLKIPQSSFQK